MAELTAPKHLIIVEASRGWLKLNWRELWEYRDLLVVLVQRDFISRYKQTILGPAWFLLQPLLNTLVFTIVFSHIAKIGLNEIPPPVFFLCGQLAWNYFSQNITAGAGTFLNNSHILDKVYFPRLILPASAIVANLVSFGLQAIPFFLFFAFYKITGLDHGVLQLSWSALWVIPLVLEIALFSLGVSLWMSAVSAKYRDIVHLNQYLMQIWMYGSAVIFPLSLVPKNLSWIVALNPMAGIVESFRIVLLGRGSVQMHEIFIGIAITFVSLITGIMIFQRVERTVADSI